MSDLGAFAIEHAPWLMLGALALFMARLLGNIRRSEKEEHDRQTAVAEGRIVGFLEQDGRITREPAMYPNSDDHGMLVVYEFEPTAQGATIRGQDTVLQDALARIRVGTRVRVRFNPKLPAHSRLDARDAQAFAVPAVPSTFPQAVREASTHLNWMALAFIGAGFAATLFTDRKFVPSSESVILGYLIATACSACIFVFSRRVPARLPETPASRFVTLWVRPPIYALVTLYFLPAFFGHLLPAAITRVSGTAGERVMSVSGHESVFVRGGKYGRLQWRCAKAEFEGIPSRLVGDEVLCEESDALLAEGTAVTLRGQVSPFGILVDQARW